VEALYEVTVSPNIVLYIDTDGGETALVGISDQRLYPNLVHAGNLYPPEADRLEGMVASARELTDHFRADGLSGFVGYDFVEYPRQGGGESGYFLAEVNAKVNGSCYPRAMMEHLNRRQGQEGGPYIEAFLTAFIPTELPTFADLERAFGHLFFDPRSARGIVPYNTGCLSDGRFALAVFGSSRDDVKGQYQSFLDLVS
jgi:hypothetical protein